MKRKISILLIVMLCLSLMCATLAACNETGQEGSDPTVETPVDPGTETPGTGDEPSVDDPEDPAPSQPETYSVTFVADGNVVSVVSYSENTATISEPSVPNMTGYTGTWEQYSLGAANIIVNAVYTPIEYTVTFVADGATVGTAVYTVENRDIAEPLVPEKTGYSAEWENYTLTTGDITIHALYTPIVYTVIFVADNETVAERTYTVENTNVLAPPVPSKAHYTATWEEYTLTTGDLTVNAVYTPIEYIITFVADGETVGKVGYTIEDDAVAEPQVPYKENCVGTWEDYTLSGGNFTVNALYVMAMEFALTTDSSFYVVLRYTGNEEEVEVPAMYNGLRVVAIAENAFSGNTATRKITLPNSIEQIQSGAFSGCTALTDINIPANAQLIGNNAFEGCTSLQTISLGRSVTTIGESAFANCTALRSIALNEGLTAIGSFAFDGCTALTDITLPNSLNSLGTGVFRHAESLETINIPSLITAIPNVTFQYCLSLKSAVIPATVSEIGHSAFSYCYGLESLRIEGDITTIGDSVFFNCYSMTSVYYNSSTEGDVGNENYIFYNAGTSSDGITLTLGTKAVIPDNLFDPLSDTNKPFITKMVFEDGRTSITSIYPEGLPYLESVTIPDSVTTIEANAFNGCEGAFHNENDIVYADGWVISCDAGATAVILRDGVRGIADSAFEGCSNVFSLTIPEKFSNLKADDFTAITNITYAVFPMTAAFLVPKNVLQNAVITSGTLLPDSAFSNCTSLISITLPDELTSIGNSAFNYCTGLTSITIPDSVISIESYTFSDCTAEIIWGDNPSIQQIGDHAFAGYAGTTLIIPDSVTSIASGALSGCSSLESITIPFVGGSAGKTSSDTYQYPFGYIFGTSSYIGGTAVTQYYHVSSTAGITSTTNYIPSSLRSVTVTGGNLLYGAFYGCSMLTSVTIHGDMTSIEECAFYECTGLKSITIPDRVTSIGANAFYWCTEVNAVYISDITAWRKIVFNGNYATPLYYTPHLYLNGKLVTDLVISDGVTSIREQYCNGCANLTSIKIPDSVTSIGSYAFSGCTAEIIWGDNPSIQQIGDHAFAGYAGTALAIPDNVTSIGSYAFYNCTGLKSVTIPDSVTSIGWSAFSGCTGLTSVTIPDSVTSIASYAFDGCTSLNAVYITDLAAWCGISFGNSYANPLHHALMYLDGELVTNLVIPDSVTSIGSYAFYWCTSLTSITIGDGVTSIGEHAFDNCTGLKSVTIPDSVTSIGSSAFSGCDGLKAVYITDLSTWCGISFGFPLANPLSYAHNLYLNGELVTDLVIPDNVTSIGNSAFSGCAGLTSITIPNSVTSIGWSAFSSCTGLTSVTIPDSVMRIGDHAFSVCSSLESITIPFVGGSAGKTSSSTYQYPFGYIFGTSYYIGGTAVQQRYRSSTSITTYSTYYIPSSLRSVTVTGGNILYGAFYNCSMLTSVTIPNSVTSIGSYAFSGCTAEIIWGDNPSIQQIGDHAFAGYAGTALAIPDNVTSIGEHAFDNCTGLKSVTIPDSVTNIGGSAFSRCTGLNAVHITDLVSWCEITFDDSPANPLCYAHNLYLNGELVTALVIPDSVTSIGEHAFDNCTGLTSVTIPDGVTSIGDEAFSGCSGLTSITIPDSVTSIGWSAFSGCTAEIIWGDNPSIQQIGALAFAGYAGTALAIPDSVTSIGDSAFSFCDGLTSITIPDSVTSIGSYAFRSCSSLTSITIPDSVTSIGDSAFAYCDGLTSVTIGSDVTSIGDSAFAYCDGLTSITIPNSVTSIGSSAFSGCAGLTSVTIGSGVTSIGWSAFSGCSSLESITIPFVGGSAGKTSSDTYQYPFGYIFGTSSYTGGTAVRQYYYGSSTSSTTYSTYYIPSSLRSVTVTGGNILYGAFYGCSMLTSVTIGDRVTSIGSYAFYNCTNLASVTLGGTTGWYLALFSSATSGTSLSSSSLADPSTAATWLTSTYRNYYWKRR